MLLAHAFLNKSHGLYQLVFVYLSQYITVTNDNLEAQLISTNEKLIGSLPCGQLKVTLVR